MIPSLGSSSCGVPFLLLLIMCGARATESSAPQRFGCLQGNSALPHEPLFAIARACSVVALARHIAGRSGHEL
jgi:hypothetical protein